MMKRLICLCFLLLPTLAFSADIERMEFDRDGNFNPFNYSVSPVGRNASITSSNSNSFAITIYNDSLVISLNGTQDTISLNDGSNTKTFTTREIVEQINTKLGLEIYAKQWKDEEGRNKIVLFADGNTNLLQVIACRTGAETVLGLSTIAVYAIAPNLNILINGGIPSPDNPMPGTIASDKTVIDTFESVTGWGYTAPNTLTFSASSSHTWGSNSLKITKANTQAYTVLAGKTYSAAKDLSAYNHGVFMIDAQIDSVTYINTVFIRLGTDSANYAEWALGSEHFAQSKWESFRFKIGENFTESGTGFVASNVQYIAIGMGMANATSLPSIYIDQLEIYKSVMATSYDEWIGKKTVIKDSDSNAEAEVINTDSGYDPLVITPVDENGQTVGTAANPIKTIDSSISDKFPDHYGTNKFTTTAESITITGTVIVLTIDIIGVAGDSILFAVDNETYSYMILSGVEKIYPVDLMGMTITNPVIKLHSVDSSITSISIYGMKTK